MPSTPDTEYIPDMLNTPDHEDVKIIHQYLKQQQNPQTLFSKLTINTNTLDNQKLFDTHQISLLGTRKTLSTPESSQTDSDDVSPQIQRKRRTIHAREILPKFSISIEDDFT